MEQKIYIEGLKNFAVEKLDFAFRKSMSECGKIPKLADILRRFPDGFLATSQVYEDTPLTPDEKQPIMAEMDALKAKLGVKPRIVRERNAQPYPRTEANFVALIGSQTIQEWAATQNLDDDIPRSEYEIALIKQVKGYGKSRKKKHG